MPKKLARWLIVLVLIILTGLTVYYWLHQDVANTLRLIPASITSATLTFITLTTLIRATEKE